jgi:hypothetical protein
MDKISFIIPKNTNNSIDKELYTKIALNVYEFNTSDKNKIMTSKEQYVKIVSNVYKFN